MVEKIDNPFNISFGEVPENYITRTKELNQITSSFDGDVSESKIYVIAGPRGSGKTVFLSQVKELYEKKDNWVTIDLNPYSNMLEQLCSKLYEKGKVKSLFLKADFNFSFQGLSFSIHGDNPVSNVDSMLDKMFLHLKKRKMKTLITIDDIHPNENVKYFIHAYQSFIREKYNVYLLITGLYENISNLENDKGLTFLVRAPKIYLEKLNMRSVAMAYKNLLKVDEEKAIQLAKFSMGYAYGFQLLGNLLYKNDNHMDEELLDKYDLTITDNVYSFVWDKLSKKEKSILVIIAQGYTSVSEIMEKANINNSALQVYKNRLYKAGLIDTSVRAQITLSLPRFKEFLLFQKEIEALE